LLKTAQRFFDLSKCGAWFLTLFYFFASWSLSKSHIFLIDSGSPFFITGYSDTLVSVGSFLIFYMIAISRLEYLNKSVLLFVISFGWAWFAPQNILFGLVMLSLIFVSRFLKDGMQNAVKFECQPLVASFIAIVFASVFGGMLSTSSHRTISDIPGILEASQGVGPVIKTSFDYLVFHSSEPGFRFSYNSINLQVEAWKIIQFLFVPLLGVVVYFFFKKQSKMFKYEFGIYAFVATLLFCLLISFGENKWAVSRFMLPGFIISLAALAQILENKLRQTKNIQIRIFLVLALIIFFVPTLNTAYFRWHYYFTPKLIQSTSKLLILNNDIGRQNAN
jgi:hypothetical protein